MSTFESMKPLRVKNLSHSPVFRELEHNRKYRGTLEMFVVSQLVRKQQQWQTRGHQRRLLSLWEKTGKKGSWAHSSRQASQESHTDPLPLPSVKHKHPHHLALRRTKPSDIATVLRPMVQGTLKASWYYGFKGSPGDLSWEDNPRWPPSPEHTQSWDAGHAKGQWKGYLQLLSLSFSSDFSSIW